MYPVLGVSAMDTAAASAPARTAEKFTAPESGVVAVAGVTITSDEAENTQPAAAAASAMVPPAGMTFLTTLIDDWQVRRANSLRFSPRDAKSATKK